MKEREEEKEKEGEEEKEEEEGGRTGGEVNRREGRGEVLRVAPVLSSSLR